MVFWIVAAALTFGVCLALLAPLARQRADAPDSLLHELEVYKDQLREIERDMARGLINPGEAELARAEIGRKIIRLSETSDTATAPRTTRAAGRWIGAFAVLSLPVVSWGLYAATGSPNYPGQRLQARLAQDPAQASVEELIARAEAHLAANPQDARGWDVLAPIYLRLGRFGDAASAYANAIRLDAPTAARLSGQGEALMAAANGSVTPAASALFAQAVVLDGNHLRSRYFIGLAAAQAGDAGQAERVWQDMLADLPADSPWQGVVTAAMDNVAAGAQTAPQAGTGQTDMIDGMVAGLAARLEANPNDVDGWQQLIRSYMVLERPDDAQDALVSARETFGPTSPEASHLAAYGLSLGLEVGD